MCACDEWLVFMYISSVLYDIIPHKYDCECIPVYGSTVIKSNILRMSFRMKPIFFLASNTQTKITWNCYQNVALGLYGKRFFLCVWLGLGLDLSVFIIGICFRCQRCFLFANFGDLFFTGSVHLFPTLYFNQKLFRVLFLQKMPGFSKASIPKVNDFG